MATLPRVPTENATQYTLDGALSSGGTTMTLSATVDSIIRAPGYIVVDRVDSGGNSTPSKREYIKFTGVSGTDLTGLTRGLAGSSDQDHAVGAVAELVPDVLYEQDWYDWAIAEHDTAGVHASLPSLTYIKAINYNASGASLTAFQPIRPVFTHVGNISSVSTIGVPLDMPATGEVKWVSAVLRSPVSSASLVVDIEKNGTSIFDTGTRPSILGGGTFVSTASIATKAFNEGDVMTAFNDNTGNGEDLSIKFYGI